MAPSKTIVFELSAPDAFRGPDAAFLHHEVPREFRDLAQAYGPRRMECPPPGFWAQLRPDQDPSTASEDA